MSVVVTLLRVAVGMVLTLSVEGRPPRAAQSNLPVSPGWAGLVRGCAQYLTLTLPFHLCGQDLAGQAWALVPDTEVDSVPSPLGLLSPQALLGLGQGWLAGCPSVRPGEGHSSVQRLPRLFSVCETQCSCTGPGWTQPGLSLPPEPSHCPAGVGASRESSSGCSRWKERWH